MTGRVGSKLSEMIRHFVFMIFSLYTWAQMRYFIREMWSLLVFVVQQIGFGRGVLSSRIEDSTLKKKWRTSIVAHASFFRLMFYFLNDGLTQILDQKTVSKKCHLFFLNGLSLCAPRGHGLFHPAAVSCFSFLQNRVLG